MKRSFLDKLDTTQKIEMLTHGTYTTQPALKLLSFGFFLLEKENYSHNNFC